MNEGPKKIHLKYFGISEYYLSDDEADTTYIRADLVDGMQEALEVASDIFPALYCDCWKFPGDEECLRCYGMDSMTAALEAGKVDG